MARRAAELAYAQETEYQETQEQRDPDYVSEWIDNLSNIHYIF